MRKVNYIILILFTALIFVACSSDDLPDKSSDNRVELSYSISNFNISGPSTRATDVGTSAEQQIDNLYLFLFGSGSTTAITHFIDVLFPVANGTWNEAAKKVTLKLTQAEAGERQVYVVANVSSTLKTTLDGVTTLAGLQTAMESTDTPWSPNMTTPILMSGSATHNFVTNRILNNVPLTRALAKVELNVTLPEKHQDADPSHYMYNFIDFDKNTYVFKPDTKTDVLIGESDWQPWEATSNVSSYLLASGKITSLKIVTYINERDNAGSYIDIQLPFNDGGPLPPPEFGDETFKLPLPDKIERNHWYKFDVTL